MALQDDIIYVTLLVLSIFYGKVSKHETISSFPNVSNQAKEIQFSFDVIFTIADSNHKKWKWLRKSG